jgi:predicted metal-binding membrane protein
MAAAPNFPGALPSFRGALLEWSLMSVAMMLPLALPAVRHVGVNSLRRRRPRAMAIYVAVYVVIWIGFGAIALAGLNWLRRTMPIDGRILLASALVIAAAWQVTAFKRRALFQCKRTLPLPPVGLRADAGCARFAGLQGWRCIKSCWALMMVMAVGGHASPLLMIAMTALVLIEEWTFIGRRAAGISAGVLAAGAAVVALVAGSR